jgi:hypothetical protein
MKKWILALWPMSSRFGIKTVLPNSLDFLLFGPLLLAFGCGGGDTPVPSPAPAPVVTTVKVTPATATIPVGTTQDFAAQAFDQNGAGMSSITFAWSSSDGTMTVSCSGVATGDTVGSATVTATANGVAGQASVTVTSPPGPILTAVIISPGVPITATVGESVAYTAWAYDQNGNLIQSLVAFTWTAYQATPIYITPASVQDSSTNGKSVVYFTGSNQSQATISVSATFNGATIAGTCSPPSPCEPALTFVF